MRPPTTVSFFFFFNDTATTEIYTLSLHDALPISYRLRRRDAPAPLRRLHGVPAEQAGPDHVHLRAGGAPARRRRDRDRKSTRLNSSHLVISYAVFCLKKKKKHLTFLRHIRFTVNG